MERPPVVTRVQLGMPEAGTLIMSAGSSSNLGAVAGTAAAVQKSAGVTTGLLLGLGLATWMEFYTYDGVKSTSALADSFAMTSTKQERQP